MQKRGLIFSVLILFTFILVSGIIFAQDNDSAVAGNENTDTSTDDTGTAIGSSTDNADTSTDDVTATETDAVSSTTQTTEEEVLDEVEQEYASEEITDSGITPDSAFYFVDEFFDRFGDDIANREERISEIKSMIEAGDYQSAKKALQGYKEYAGKLEKDVDPEKREEARRSAAVIHKALKEVKDEIPEEEREEFYDDIIKKESGIVTAVEISSKIKDLCVQLAELDPMEYSRVCKIEGDVPDWKKKLNDKLTEEQKIEAKKFGEIMSECFETSGNNCRCEDISFYDFSITCSKIAPLASKCDKGDEESCQMMDEIEMPELPPHLQEVFNDVEMQYGESRYGMQMPPECIEEGVSTPKECMLIMVRVHAPFECKDALKEAIESGKIKDERGAREICDKIMMPPECEGMNPNECARNMMPPECVEKELSPKECKKLMDSTMKPGIGPRQGFGKNCGEIQDSMERLKCYDNMGNDMGEQYGVGEKYKEDSGELTWQCKENRIHSSSACEEFMKEEWPEQEKMKNEERMKNEEMWKQDEEKWRQEYPREYRPPEGGDNNYRPPEDNNYRPPEDNRMPPTQDNQVIPGPDAWTPGGEYVPGESSPPEVSDGSGEGAPPTTSSGGEGYSGGEGSSSGGGDSGGGEGITGGVFWEYYTK